MKVTLEYFTPDAAYAIGHAASICYDSSLDREACIRRAKHCMKSGHLATLRFATATVLIEGISRVASHQLVRVAHAGVLQASQRYIAAPVIEYVRPPALAGMPAEFVDRWELIQAAAADIYQEALDGGMKKEDARYILPQSCATSLRITGNLQMWRDLLANRSDKAAQWEVREVALEIVRLFADQAPELFSSP